MSSIATEREPSFIVTSPKSSPIEKGIVTFTSGTLKEVSGKVTAFAIAI